MKSIEVKESKIIVSVSTADLVSPDIISMK